MRAALMQRGWETGFARAIEMEYLDPLTHAPCLPTLGFTAMMLPYGIKSLPPRRSAGAVFHVIEGEGRSTSNDVTIDWRTGDTFSAPSFAQMEHFGTRTEPAFMIRIDDAPLRSTLGIYEERPRR
jgi:gentisate 1,2-dioxygenase